MGIENTGDQVLVAAALQPLGARAGRSSLVRAEEAVEKVARACFRAAVLLKMAAQPCWGARVAIPIEASLRRSEWPLLHDLGPSNRQLRPLGHAGRPESQLECARTKRRPKYLLGSPGVSLQTAVIT